MGARALIRIDRVMLSLFFKFAMVICFFCRKQIFNGKYKNPGIAGNTNVPNIKTDSADIFYKDL